MKKQKPALLPFSKLSIFVNRSSSMNTKGQLNSASAEKIYLYIPFDHFSHFSKSFEIVPIPRKTAHYAVIFLGDRSRSKLNFCPPQHLFTDG